MWLKFHCGPLFSMIILIWIVEISNIVWAYISILVSVLVIQINAKCPFLTKWLITTIGIYRCKAFHRWINTLWFTDFKMEMSTGVSLLRTAQSLLTGQTIDQSLLHIHEVSAFTVSKKFNKSFVFLSKTSYPDCPVLASTQENLWHPDMTDCCFART